VKKKINYLSQEKFIAFFKNNSEPFLQLSIQ
jgi:hypothetical protein